MYYEFFDFTFCDFLKGIILMCDACVSVLRTMRLM
jgi:hypothetical protein